MCVTVTVSLRVVWGKSCWTATRACLHSSAVHHGASMPKAGCTPATLATSDAAACGVLARLHKPAGVPLHSFLLQNVGLAVECCPDLTSFD